MTTDRDIADKRNEVTMLRLQINEHKERRRLDEIEQSELTDVDALREANETIHNAKTYIKVLEAELSNSKSAIVMKNGVINDRVEHLERVYNQLHGFQDDMHEKNKTIDGLNETISDLRMAASDMLDTIDELKDFIRDQCGCVDDRDNRIEQLIVLNEALRVDIDGQDNHIEALKSTVDFGQSRIDLLVEKKSNCIDELMKDLDARNTVIKDFKAIEQKETDRLHTVIAGNGKIIDELNDMYCDVCGKLERIENISKKARTFGDVINRVSANHIAIDEITKIIQEE